MSYIIKTEFLGEAISYDLVKGEFQVTDSDGQKRGPSFQGLFHKSERISNSSDFICLTISVTSKCNLRCTYCFERHEDTFLQSTSIDRICEVISDYIETRVNVKRVIVIWFGGEPLLNLSYIEKASKKFVELCKRNNLEYSSRVISNGLNIDKIASRIREFRISDIQVTLDGPKNYHNKRRISASGKGSFDRIISNLKLLKDPVNIIIRSNIDIYNLNECYELYHYVHSIKLNKAVKLYFQPMLVEDYGGESSCYEGLILNDYDLNEDYLDLLEYCNSLEIHHYIKAFCNVGFSGSLAIRSDGSLCKCWAKISEIQPVDQTSIFDDTKQVLEYMSRSSMLYKENCVNCEVYPVCLGGCVFKQYSKEDCNCIRKNVFSKIYRLYLMEKSKETIEFKILYNEFKWLQSIGCKIRYNENGITVKCPNCLTSDFNFQIGFNLNANCIRLSTRMKNFEALEERLLHSGFRKDSSFDINYIRKETDIQPSIEIYQFEQVPLNTWKIDTTSNSRAENKFTKFYHIIYKDNVIGGFSIAVTNLVGIYDYYIFEDYQHKGHGKKALGCFLNYLKTVVFIQTWKENEIARRCYEGLGFEQFEVLYRYVR